MKKQLLMLLLLFTSIDLIGQSYQNITIRYALVSGNEVVTDPNDGSKKVKLPTGRLVDRIAFYQGTDGADFNYCTKHGMQSQLVKVKNKPIKKHMCVGNDGKFVSIARLAFESGDYEYLYGIGAPPPDSLPEDPGDPEDPEDPGDPPPPPPEPTFKDYRNHNNVDYTSPVVDQACDNCYAEVGALMGEMTIRLETNKQISYDLDELFLTNCADEYNHNIWGCSGPGPYGISLLDRWGHFKLMSEVGIPIENPSIGYVDYDCNPLAWTNYERAVFNGWNTISANAIAVINHLKYIGPVAADVRYKTLGNFLGYNIDGFPNNNSEILAGSVTYDQILFGPPIWDGEGEIIDHAITIIGYGYAVHNSVTYLYWVVQNSYGSSWGANGIGFIDYDSFEILTDLAYLYYSPREIACYNYFIGTGTTEATIFLDNVPVKNDGITWNVYEKGTTTLSTIVTPNNGIDSPAEIEFVVNSDPGEVEVEFTVFYDDDDVVGVSSCPQAEYTEIFSEYFWAGPPLAPTIVSYSDPCSSTRTYEATNYAWSGAESIFWSVSGGIRIQDTTDNECTITQDPMSSGTLTCTFSNPVNNCSATITLTEYCPTMMSYPNPAGDELYIDVDNIEENSDVEMEVYDSYGKKRKLKITKNKDNKLYVTDLEEGTYYLKVKVKDLEGNPVLLEDQVIISR